MSLGVIQVPAQYLVIDQKSYYATVECVARGLDPMKTNLVVADPDRSQNTICLAVSPSMKALIIGTYASIFIATPIMFDVTKKAEAKKADK